MADTKDIPIVKPSVAKGSVKAALKTKRPVFLWGKPGVGKSAIVKQLCEELGIGFIDLRLVQLDPVDLRGLPYKIEDSDGVRMGFAPSNILPRSGKGILFLDELPQAPTMVQNAASELLLDRRCGEYELPDGWIMVAAGNRRTDRAGTVEIPRHLLNRLEHLEVTEDVGDWVAWATGAKVNKAVIDYIQANPKMLHQFNPDQTACPTCRTWEFVSDTLNNVTEETIGADWRQIRKVKVQGAIGKGAATQFLATLSDDTDRPTFDQIVQDAGNASIPEMESVLFAVQQECVAKVSEANVEAVMNYFRRIQKEVAMTGLFEIMAKNKKLAEHKAVVALGKELQIIS